MVLNGSLIEGPNEKKWGSLMHALDRRGWSTLISRVCTAGRPLVLATIATLAGAPLAWGSPAQFNIPSEPMPKALEAFAAQSHMQLLYQSTTVAAAMANAVSGELDTHQALEALLLNTGLEAIYSSDSAATIRAVDTKASVSVDIPAGDLGAALSALAHQTHITIRYSRALVRGKSTQGLSGSYAPADALRMLLTGTGLAATAANASTYVLKALPKPKSVAIGPSPEGTEHVLVAGAGVTPYEPGGNVDIQRTIDDVQPYYIFDSTVIEQSGATNIEDFLKQQLTMNTQYQSNNQVYGNAAGATQLGNTSSINLRGLGTDETLILVNGHRMPGVTVQGSTYQPDVNGIPLEAIDRIEVLPSSASGIYGGSAMGGVVNIILKKDYNGGDLRLTYDKPTDSHARTRGIDGTYGLSFEGGKTNVMISASYSQAEPLLVGDRSDLADQGLARILTNCPQCAYNTIFPYLGGATPNIVGLNGMFQASNLILADGENLGTPYAHIAPGCTPSEPVKSCLLPGFTFGLGPGTGEYGALQPVGPTVDNTAVNLSINHAVTDWFTTFATFMLAGNRSTNFFNEIADSNAQELPSGQPFQNPIVFFSTPSDAMFPNDTNSITRSMTAGGTIHTSFGWSGEFDYTWGKNSITQLYGIESTTFLNDVENGTLNPLVDPRYLPNLNQYVVNQQYGSSSTLNDLALRGDGPIAHLPWGDPTLAVGLEYRKENYPSSLQYEPTEGVNPAGMYYLYPTYNYYLSQSQTTGSLYAEATVPLVTEKNALPGVHSLDVQIADRIEHYSVSAGTTEESVSYQTSPPETFYSPTPANANADGSGGTPLKAGPSYSSNNETVGLKWKPVEDAIVRVSHATAFLPPTFTQLVPSPVVCQLCDTITDPKNGQTYQVNTLRGGDPNLGPQTSKSWNGGVIWEPKEAALAGVRVDLEYYDISQFNVIILPDGNQILSSPTYADRVTRSPTTGLITQINESYINAPEFRTEGYDLSMDWQKPTSVGNWHFRAAATLIRLEDRQLSIGGPTADYVGWPDEGGETKLKLNGTLTWARNGWTLGWSTRWYASYNVNETAGDPVWSVIPGSVPCLTAANNCPAAAQGSTTIPSQIYHDLFVSYAFGKSTSGSLAGRLSSDTSVQLVVKDVFNAFPPFDYLFPPFYYSAYGSLNGRTISLSFRKAF
jgi:iron complex outermembrane recepter protein